jgi:hypothetical protein
LQSRLQYPVSLTFILMWQYITLAPYSRSAHIRQAPYSRSAHIRQSPYSRSAHIRQSPYSRSAHNTSLPQPRQLNKVLFGRQQRPDLKVLHFHISTLLSARQRFIEFCRQARFKTYLIMKYACFDRVKHNRHQASCCGSA